MSDSTLTKNMLQPFPRRPATPMAIKRSSLPDQINFTARLSRHPFNTHVLGHHDYMEQIYTNEFSGGAMVKGVNDLHAVLFQKDDFPAQLKPARLRKACVARGLYDDVRKCWPHAPHFSIPSQEPAIAKFFEEILDLCRSLLPPSLEKELDKRYWTAAFRNDTLPGGVIDRRPDVVELALNLDQIWENSYSDAQIKSSSRDTEAAAKQLHDGALNCLSTQDNRLHHIGLGVIERMLFLSCYDRCGCVRSKPIDIHANPEVFLWALVGVSLLPKVHLGFDMSITRNDIGHRLVTVEDVEYLIVKQLNQNISIHGRGTVVWHGKKVKGGQDVAIKSAWTDISRAHNEIDVLKLANSKKVPNVPTLAGHENVKRRGVNASTATLRAQVCTPEVLEKLEVREYVRFVMEQYGSPLGTFASIAELLSVVLDGVEGKSLRLDASSLTEAVLQGTSAYTRNATSYTGIFTRRTSSSTIANEIGSVSGAGSWSISSLLGRLGRRRVIRPRRASGACVVSSLT